MATMFDPSATTGTISPEDWAGGSGWTQIASAGEGANLEAGKYANGQAIPQSLLDTDLYGGTGWNTVGGKGALGPTGNYYTPTKSLSSNFKGSWLQDFAPFITMAGLAMGAGGLGGAFGGAEAGLAGGFGTDSAFLESGAGLSDAFGGAADSQFTDFARDIVNESGSLKSTPSMDMTKLLSLPSDLQAPSPVEDKSRLFDPRGGVPNFGNVSASLLSNAGASPGFASNFADLFGGTTGGVGFGNPLNAGSSIYSALDARNRAKKLQEMTQQIMSQIGGASANADPWGTSGGRSSAAAQLSALEKDPSGAMASDPRFAAMIQAAQRATSQYGQNSGAMNIAGAKAGGDWFTQRQAELAGLAGTGNAGIPVQGLATAGQIGIQGNVAANTLAGSGLASLGYGLNTLTGGGATSSIPAPVLQWMRSQGMKV